MLAQVSGLHSKTVDICLNHIAGEAGGVEALNYIRSLGRSEQEQLLQQYGKTLISKFKLEMEVRPQGELCCVSLVTLALLCIIEANQITVAFDSVC